MNQPTKQPTGKQLEFANPRKQMRLCPPCSSFQESTGFRSYGSLYLGTHRQPAFRFLGGELQGNGVGVRKKEDEGFRAGRTCSRRGGGRRRPCRRSRNRSPPRPRSPPLPRSPAASRSEPPRRYGTWRSASCLCASPWTPRADYGFGRRRRGRRRLGILGGGTERNVGGGEGRSNE